MGDFDYLREARGRTISNGQVLDLIVRTIETMAAEDEHWRPLADDLHPKLVDADTTKSSLRSRTRA